MSLIASLVLSAALALPVSAAKSSEELVADLKSADSAVRLQARDGLVAGGGKSVKALVGLAVSDRARSTVQSILLRIGPAKVAPELIKLLPDQELGGRAGSLLFSVIGPESIAQAPQLLDCVRQLPEVANYCGTSLVKVMSPAGAMHMGRLAKALRDGNPLVRTYAAASLARIGRPAAAAVPKLTAALSDTDPNVRWNAAAALGSIGPAAKIAAPQLKNALNDPSPEVKRHAEEALKSING